MCGFRKLKNRMKNEEAKRKSASGISHTVSAFSLKLTKLFVYFSAFFLNGTPRYRR